MAIPNLSNLAISVEKEAPSNIAKASFPLRYGKYSEIRTSDYEFIFNLNGEIKFIRGLNTNWPHPAEQLKRTDGNDWVYYSVLYMAQKDRFHPKAKHLIGSILDNNDKVMHERSRKLHHIIGGRVSVLPPDTRHVDYEIIPLNIADGCLYHCKFCCVKSERLFKARTENDIIQQIRNLKLFYGRNLENHNALFLGNHDALAAGEDLIFMAASKAYIEFDFGTRTKSPFLFLFASVDSLLNSKNQLFEKLNHTPFYTYINVGLESIDTATLKFLGKPLNGSRVVEAFKKALDINERFKNIEITANFVIGEGLSETHYQSLIDLIRDTPMVSRGKGGIYLSPLKDNPKKRELLPLIKGIKSQSKIPAFIYLIQRL